MDCFAQKSSKRRIMTTFYKNMDPDTRKMILRTLNRIKKINGKLTGDNKILFSVLKSLDLIEGHKSKQYLKGKYVKTQ